MKTPQIDLFKLSAKELRDFITWAELNTSKARTILATSAKFKSKSKSDSYAASVEKHKRIGEAVKHIIKVGDVISVRGSKCQYDGKVKAVNSHGVVLNRGNMVKTAYGDYIFRDMDIVTEHMFDKIKAIWNEKTNGFEKLD